MERDLFTKSKISPFSAMGLLLGITYLLTRAPVVAVIKGIVWLGAMLIRPVVFLFGMVKAWRAAHRPPAGKVQEVDGTETMRLSPREREA